MLYKRILVAIDGSNTSNKIMKESINIAKPLHAKLYVLHVIEKLPDHIAYAIDIKKYQIAARKEGEALLKNFYNKARKNKIPIETKLIEIIDYKKSVSEIIISTLKSWKGELLIIGTHGRKGFSRFMLGSVAKEILMSVTKPVLVVRDIRKKIIS